MADLVDVSLPLLVFAAGVGLTAAEAFIPGAHFIVLGVALLVAGLLGIVVPVLGSPLAMAATTLLVGALTLYLYRRLGIYQGTGQATTSDSASLKGKEGIVTERVTTTGGEVKLDDGGFNPYYLARSMDGQISEGERVLVVDPGGGNVVTVEALGNVHDDIDRELARERRRSDASDEGADDREPEYEGTS